MPIGQADRAAGAGFAQPGGDGPVGGGLAVRDGRQDGPDLAGKFAAGQVQRHVERGQVSGEIPRQFLLDLLQVVVVPWRHGIAETVLQGFNLPGQRRPVEELQQHQPTALGHGDHRSQRRGQAREQQRLTVGCATGGDVEGFLEGIAKTAQGLVAAVERRAVDGVALFDAAQRHAQAARAQPGMKGHAEMLLEPAPQFQRLDAGGQQPGIGPALLGIGFHRLEQRLYPIRGDGRGVQGFTAQAGTIARRQAFVGMGEELDILRLWLACRAAGTTENPGGFDRGKKHPLVGGVAFEHGANHLGVGRK